MADTNYSSAGDADEPVFMRVDRATKRYDISRSWFLELVAAGVLPKPRRLGPRCTVWERAKLDEVFNAPDFSERLAAHTAQRRALKDISRNTLPAGRVA